MKKMLLVAIPIAFTLFACSKSWMEDRLEGTWRLKTVERNSFLNWKSINTGFEGGVFLFNNDGTAIYSRNQLSMNGDWRIRKVRDRYRSNDGDEDEKIRMALSIHLIDFNVQKTLNLDFDEMHFRGRNRLLAEYQSSGYRYRYEFVRD
jgi:hypothetical protein